MPDESPNSGASLTSAQSGDLLLSATDTLTRIREILTRARHQILQSVNTVMVQAYWNIGREIVEEEQRGKARADYGA